MFNELFKVAVKISSAASSPFKSYSDELHIPAKGVSFSGFDAIFQSQSKSESSIQEECRKCVKSFIQGKDQSVILLGQERRGGWLMGRSGLIQHSISQLFQLKKDLILRVSLLQISNQQIFDILQSNGPLPVLQNKDQFFVKGLAQITLSSSNQALALFYSTIYSYPLSPKSHLFMQLSQQGCKSVFNLVQLAQTEPSCGQQYQISLQTRNVKKSLFYFSQVIKELSQEKIPCYRNSALTKLLKKSFQSESERWLVICLSSEEKDIDQSIRLLKLGLQAKKAKGRVTQHKQNIQYIKSQIQKVTERIRLKTESDQCSHHQRLQRQNQLLKQKISVLQDISYAPYNLTLHSQFLKVLYAEESISQQTGTQIWEFQDLANNMQNRIRSVLSKKSMQKQNVNSQRSKVRMCLNQIR